ncbi:hypothetical protein IWQ57_002887 [Coemansia nantahalensis]|uniref:Uncharacterized protein n=1 Tax=Coemansia nantahalensis TaxID=2789366 RepID=A0ACC1JYF0_9FUNG|nr:hypothetical protein IWQ57_002887 [Coemansia nantahalensis]
MSSLPCAGGVPLSFSLKTHDSLLGRLQNIRFIATCTMETVVNYYWKGPERKSWSLRFHITRDILRRYLTESLPHDTPNDATESIDFGYIAEYIAMNCLPMRGLLPSEGCNWEHDIVVDAQFCTQYGATGYGLSGAKLRALAAGDLEAAKRGEPRSFSCQVVASARVARCWVTGRRGPACYDERLLALAPVTADERIILHFHGGAYCVGERSLTHIPAYAGMSDASGLRVISPNYRLAPRHHFPSQLHDCFVAYMSLLQRGFQPANIVLAGDSAGGALALGLLFLLRDMKLPAPAALALISPWVDATCSGESWASSPNHDYLPTLSFEDPFHPTRMFYAPGRRFSDEMLEEVRCPLVSPLFGDLANLPPMLVQKGCDELLRDDIDAFVDKAERSGANVRLEGYDHMPHAFILFDFAKEAQQAFRSIASFAHAHTSEPARSHGTKRGAD